MCRGRGHGIERGASDRARVPGKEIGERVGWRQRGRRQRGRALQRLRQIPYGPGREKSVEFGGGPGGAEALTGWATHWEFVGHSQRRTGALQNGGLRFGNWSHLAAVFFVAERDHLPTTYRFRPSVCLSSCLYVCMSVCLYVNYLHSCVCSFPRSWILDCRKPVHGFNVWGGVEFLRSKIISTQRKENKQKLKIGRSIGDRFHALHEYTLRF